MYFALINPDTRFFFFLIRSSQNRRPRIWRPAAPCPECAYLNDDTFNFCQMCGTRREVAPVPESSICVDLTTINERLLQLQQKKKRKPYEKQKSSLARELCSFLAALPIPKTLHSTTAPDILAFLVWKDKSGRTKVHALNCPCIGNNQAKCLCPTRLASGTVDSIIGKLKSIFIQAGLGGSWDDRLGTGNPVSHHSIKDYLRAIKEEQAEARTLPHRSIPIFLNKLGKVLEHILALLCEPNIPPISVYILSRDLAFFAIDFFSGDRGSDLGRCLSKEILFSPDYSALLFNHSFGKTLRGDALNTFAVRRCENHTICPVRNFERYLALCKLMHIDLTPGYLFRSASGGKVTEQPFCGSAVNNRLKLHLRSTGVDEGETPHSLRSGCSITLSLLGVDQEAIAHHVGWSSTKMLRHYTDLREALKPDGPAATLSAGSSDQATAAVVRAYKTNVDVSQFNPAFL